MRKNLIIISKIERLGELLDENENIFFEEREWLEDRTREPEIKNLDERRQENEIKIKKTIDAVSEEMGEGISKETFKPEQTRIIQLVK